MASPLPKLILSVAGSDPSGGAGLQGDLRVFAAHGLFGTAVVAGITVQNSRGVLEAHPVDGALVHDQVAALLQDLPVAGIKTGMLGSAGAVEGLVQALEGAEYAGPLVVDPVFRSSSGAALLDPAGREALEQLLIPRATVSTPNLLEARALLGPAFSSARPQVAAEALLKRGFSAVVVTGGHDTDPMYSVDCLAQKGKALVEFSVQRQSSECDHGTGCAYSAALLSALVQGESLEDAALSAQRWVARALAGALSYGPGRGSVFVRD